MKAHLTKVSLALLSTVFLLGCQEQGSSPVGPGPEFNKPNSGNCGQVHCHDDDEDPQESTVILTVGMQAGAFPVGFKDSRKTLGVGNHNSLVKPNIQMDFEVGRVGPDACVGFKATNGGTLPDDEEIDDLKLALTESAADAKVTVSIVKASLDESGDHMLQVEYTGTLGGTSILLGGWPGPVRVDADGDEFTFTGPVVVWNWEGDHKDTRLIRCPDQMVTVTLIR